MSEDQYLNILTSSEHIFQQAAQLACDLRNKVSSYSKSQTGDAGLDIVTEADLQVQEYVLSRLAETPLVDCEMIAEESTPSVSKFKGSNGLVLTIDPIDNTAAYVAGQGFFSIIIGMHNKKDILYSYYHYPLLNWTKKIVKNKVEDIGSLPEIIIKDVDPMKKIAYLSHVKPDKLPTEIEEIFKNKGLSVCDRKEISDEATMTAQVYLGKISGVCVSNPIAYDCLGVLHYALATGLYEIYSTVDLTRPSKGKFGVYYPGLYVVWRK